MIAAIREAKRADGTPFVSLDKVVDICIYPKNNEIADMQDLVTGCKYLTTFRVTVIDEELDLAFVSNMLRHTMMTLKYLEFWIVFSSNSKEDDDPLLHNLDEVIEKLGNFEENIVEDIKISVSLSKGPVKWGGLDRAFENSKWPKLRHISLITNLMILDRNRQTNRVNDLITDLENLKATQFPSLNERTSVSFDYIFKYD
ncbi:hypothetical protein BDN70DRAFT_934525 [Pholiota conissans]|uniref:Uncharacterized protein n=1 Tax=Pholiota conissans TaxID=109636 RepID=A0A9P5YZT2_9AGAR|nr:hypothetical protein BDN70DRAFT_934525 [Pholiota conissans]